MKKKGAAAALAVMVMFVMLVPQMAVAYPASQERLVNDFVGVFSAEAAERLEQKLRAHEEQTTQEVAVVVLKELGGEDIDQYASGLFKQWEIGKADEDNGVLILIATDVLRNNGIKGRLRIEVGYGLEGVLPDSKAGEILRGNLALFDQGKIAESIEGIVRDVFGAIAPAPVPKLSPEEAQRRNAERKAEYEAQIEAQRREKERKEKIRGIFLRVLRVFLSVTALGVGGWWITTWLKKLFRERQERREKREQLSELITSTKDELDKLRSYPDNAVEKFAAEPEWAKAEVADLSLKLRRLIVEAEGSFREIGIDWRQADRLDENLRTMRRAQLMISQAKETVEDIGEWPKEIERLKKLAAEYVSAAKEDRADLLKLIEQVRAEGFRVDLFPESEAATSADHLNEMEEDISSGHDPREIRNAAERMAASFGELSNQVHGLRAIESANEEHAKQQSEMLKRLSDDLPAIQSVYMGIRNGNPKSVWADLTDIGSFGESFRAVTELLAEAEADNSMAKQDFETAKTKVEAASREISKIRAEFKRIIEREQEIEKAKSGFREMFGRAKERLEEAERVVQSPDVTQLTYHDRLQSANRRIAEAKAEAEKLGLVDWLVVVGMVLAAEATAADIIKEVRREINLAEEARERARQAEEDRLRRIRAEAEERRQAQERRNRQARESSRRQSSRSSGGGFKFGGGRSGGGGASI